MFDEETINRAKGVPVETVLGMHGIHYPQKAGNFMIKSPFREESEASFKVYKSTNTWYDYGADKGGDSIKLYQELAHCDFWHAVSALSGETFDPVYAYPRTAQRDFAHTDPDSVTKIIGVSVIKSHKLVEWATRVRGIPLDVLNKWCVEVRYMCADQTGAERGPYYAIGFMNDKGGYALRSAPYRGNKKGIKRCTVSAATTIHVETGKVNDAVLVFEGFFDFLSWCALYGDLVCDAVVLNSVSNLKHLYGVDDKGVKTLYCYLDADEAGRDALKALRAYSGCDDVHDCSDIYRVRGMNDLNDYLRSEMRNAPVTQ